MFVIQSIHNKQIYYLHDKETSNYPHRIFYQINNQNTENTWMRQLPRTRNLGTVYFTKRTKTISSPPLFEHALGALAFDTYE